MPSNIHELTRAISSLHLLRHRYEREAPFPLTCPEGMLLQAIFFQARHTQQAFGEAEVEHFRQIYQHATGVIIDFSEARRLQWLRFILGQAFVAYGVSSARDRTKVEPHHQELLAFLQSLEKEIGRYDSLRIATIDAQDLAQSLLGTAGLPALERLEKEFEILRSKDEDAGFLQIVENTDLGAELAAAWWEQLCADASLQEPERLWQWIRRAKWLQRGYLAPQHLGQAAKARLVLAATDALLTEPDIQGWELEPHRFFGDRRTESLLYPLQAITWRNLPADKPVGEQLLWADRQDYEDYHDNSRTGLRLLAYIVITHDVWSGTASYSQIMRLLEGLNSRPFLLLCFDSAVPNSRPELIPWLCAGPDGFADFGVLLFIKFAGRRQGELVGTLVKGYQQMFVDLRNELLHLVAEKWLPVTPADSFTRAAAVISYELHSRYTQAAHRGVSDEVVAFHRQWEEQWESALLKAAVKQPHLYADWASLIIQELRRLSKEAETVYSRDQLTVPVVLLRGMLLVTSICRRINQENTCGIPQLPSLAGLIIQEYKDSLSALRIYGIRLRKNNLYLSELWSVLTLPWLELVAVATESQVRQWGQLMFPLGGYQQPKRYDNNLDLDVSRLRTHVAILAQTLVNAHTSLLVTQENVLALQDCLLIKLQQYVVKPLPQTSFRITDAEWEASSTGYAYPLARLCAQAISGFSAAKRGALLAAIALPADPALAHFLTQLYEFLPAAEQPVVLALFSSQLVAKALSQLQGLNQFQQLLTAFAFDSGLQEYARQVLDYTDNMLLRQGDDQQQHWQTTTLPHRLVMAYFADDQQQMDTAANAVPQYSSSETRNTIRFYQALIRLRHDPEQAYDDFVSLSEAEPDVDSYALNRFAAHIEWAQNTTDSAAKTHMLREALMNWQLYAERHPAAGAERSALYNKLNAWAQLQDHERFNEVWGQAVRFQHEPPFKQLQAVLAGAAQVAEVEVVAVQQLVGAVLTSHRFAEVLMDLKGISVEERLRGFRRQPNDQSAVGLLLCREIVHALRVVFQHAHPIKAVFENNYNAVLAAMLTATLQSLHLHTQPQDQGAYSRSGNSFALRDVVIYDGTAPVGIVEALRLSGWETENMRVHIDGLSYYDSTTSPFYILLIYYEGPSLPPFTKSLQVEMNQLNYQHFTALNNLMPLDLGIDHLSDYDYFLGVQRLQRVSNSSKVDLYVLAVRVPELMVAVI